MKYYDKQLLKAAKLGKLEQVRNSLEQGASIDCLDDDGISPLDHSIMGGYPEVVTYLLEQGAHLKRTDTINSNALPLALFRSGTVEAKIKHKMVSLLQSHGISFESAIFEKAYRNQLGSVRGELMLSEITQTDLTGYSALHYACAGGGLETVKALVAQGAKVNLGCKDNGDTPLLVAAKYGHVNIMKWLLTQGASVTERENNGYTVLLCAAHNGHLKVVQWLVGQGVSITEKADGGFSALLCAASGGHLDVVQWLVGQGASIAAYYLDVDHLLLSCRSLP